MPVDNPLNPIWDNYQTTIRCLTIAGRAIRHPNAIRLMTGDATELSTAEEIDRARDELDRLFVLALWATFERNIIEYVQGAAVVQSTTHPLEVLRALNKVLEEEIEWWRFDDILGLWKDLIDSKDLNQVRQIKKFRDGVMHRNPRTTRAGKVGPDHAHRILSIFLNRVHSTA